MVQSDKDSTNVGQKYPGPESRMEKKATQNEKAELHPRQIRGAIPVTESAHDIALP